MSERECEYRIMRCPFCGHETQTGSIGRVYCGPHQVGIHYFPAIVMRELPQSDEEQRNG